MENVPDNSKVDDFNDRKRAATWL